MSDGQKDEPAAFYEDGFQEGFVPEAVHRAQQRPEPDLDETQGQGQRQERDGVLQGVDEKERLDGEPEPAAEERAQDDVGDAEVQG